MAAVLYVLPLLHSGAVHKLARDSVPVGIDWKLWPVAVDTVADGKGKESLLHEFYFK